MVYNLEILEQNENTKKHGHISKVEMLTLIESENTYYERIAKVQQKK